MLCQKFVIIFFGSLLGSSNSDTSRESRVQLNCDPVYSETASDLIGEGFSPIRLPPLQLQMLVTYASDKLGINNKFPGPPSLI